MDELRSQWHDATRTLCETRFRWGDTATTAVVLIDPAVVGTPIEDRTHGWLRSTGWSASTIVAAGPGDLPEVLDLHARLGSASVLVAVGGGRVMDLAKLASVAGAAQRYLAVPQRSGLVALPAEICRRVALVAVPTTLGTGSESSMVACLPGPAGKRLVGGAALRPDSTVLDPLATRTLPGDLVREGVLEALVRVVSPYVGYHDTLSPQDGLAEVVAQRLLRLGFVVRDALAAGDAVPDAIRLEIARLSGYGHAPFLCRPGDPYAVKGWLLANELSDTLGVRKMVAFAALLPHLWRRIRDHDTRLGSATRLSGLWARLRQAAPVALPADPVAGALDLLDRWGIARKLDIDESLVDVVVRRVVRAWGAGLPMLPLGADEVRTLLTEAGAANATGGGVRRAPAVDARLVAVGAQH